MKRTAQAHWSGNLKDGNGSLTTQTHTLNETPYSFSARFESGQGTNPEELLAAAHAGCFTMALSLKLQEAGFVADSLETKCTITLDPSTLMITASELELTAKIPGISHEAFESATKAAKDGCPVSRLYNTAIGLKTQLN
jgi:osmotically inducible protein OsmC